MNTDKYTTIDGIKCYAPELAGENSDFPPDIFEFLAKVEEKNFWFLSRNRIIQYLFGKYVGNTNADVLEIGCGTGFVLTGLKKQFPTYRLMGSEIHFEGIKLAKKRLPEAEFVQLDATDMPFHQEFDAIGAFDVLEHITEDVLAMKEIYRALKPNRFFFISVPQYQWMWSTTDDLAYHKRRYNRAGLHDKLHQTGFSTIYTSSFVFSLFPLMYLSRLTKRKSRDIEQSNFDTKRAELNELMLPPLLNMIFYYLMRFDELLITPGFDLPFGGSLMVVAKK
jgi:SAM-dependent methyltransferase